MLFENIRKQEWNGYTLYNVEDVACWIQASKEELQKTLKHYKVYTMMMNERLDRRNKIKLQYTSVAGLVLAARRYGTAEKFQQAKKELPERK